MSAGNDNQFIVPPPGIALEPVVVKPDEPEPLDDSEMISLPPGIVDSATYRMAPSRPSKPNDPQHGEVVFLPSPGIGLAPAAPSAAEGIDDATRIAAGRRSAPAWRLTLPDGKQVLVEKTTLVGRDPAPNQRWPDALLLPIADDGKTVSKTHAVLELSAGGQLIVHDLDSTNGVWLTNPGGNEAEVIAPALVEPGADLGLGQFIVAVERS